MTVTGTPFFVPSGADALFVFHHAPASPTGHAVVLCPPAFWQYMRSHWAMRRTAQALAAAGLDVLRLDYRGTGDAGGAWGALRFQDWVDDVVRAADVIKARSGARRLSFVGLGLGGMVAARAAEQQRVRELVLWDPVVRGDVYTEDLRAEEKAFAARLVYAPPVAETGAIKQNVGIAVGPQIWNDIVQQSLLERFAPQASRVHLVRTDTVPPARKAPLAQLEAKLHDEVKRFVVHRAPEPPSTGEQWLVQHSPRVVTEAVTGQAPSTSPDEAVLRAADDADAPLRADTRRAVVFGPGPGLCGVVQTPAAPWRSTAVVLSNVGLNHRVGPSRAWVELAERLGAAGFVSLRFDTAGLGDSPPRADDEDDDIERARADLDHAVRQLGDFGIHKVVVVSNCSGTEPTHALMLSQPAARGAVFIDGYVPRIRRHQAMRWARRALKPGMWTQRAKRWFPDRFGLDARRVRWFRAADHETVFVREEPTIASLAADYQRMTARGARLLFVYSGESGYSYRRLWRHAYGVDGAGLIEVERIKEADHTFSFPRARARLIEHVVRFVRTVDEA